jgi:hypothetical protein
VHATFLLSSVQKGMILKNKIILLIILTFFYLSCKKDKSYIPVSNQLNSTEIISYLFKIGVESANTAQEIPLEFGYINDACFDEDGNIYILDSKNKCVRKFTQKGEFVAEIIKSGFGPGEINNPYRLAFNPYSKTLFVLHMDGYQIKEFNLNGDEKAFFILPQQIFNAFNFVTRNRMLYVGHQLYGDKKYYNFKVFNLRSSKIEKVISEEIVGDDRKAMFNWIRRFIIQGDKLYTSPPNEPLLEILSIQSDKLLNKIPFPENYIQNKIVSKRMGNGWLRNRMVYNYAQPFAIGKSIFLLFMRQEYSDETHAASENPIKRNFCIYKVKNGTIVKKYEGNKYEFDGLTASWRDRLLLIVNNPYPYLWVVKITD